MKLTQQQQAMLDTWTKVCEPEGRYHICSWSAMAGGKMVYGYESEPCFARFGDHRESDPDRVGWELVAFQSGGMHDNAKVMQQILTKFSHVLASTDPEFVKKYGVVMFTKKAGGVLTGDQMMNVFAFFRDFGENRRYMGNLIKHVYKGKVPHAWTLHDAFMTKSVSFSGQVVPADRGAHVAWSTTPVHRPHQATITKMKLRKFTVESLQQDGRFSEYWKKVFTHIANKELNK